MASVRRIPRALALLACLISLIGDGIISAAAPSSPASPDGNRLAYLDDFCDPYPFGVESPKLVTPQWIGEPGVEAVVTLGIDDMRDAARYEAFLRPILNRLKKIDGRAPVSIFTCTIDPNDPQLQAWLKEGLSFEVHTVDHPCPLLDAKGFEVAKNTFDSCLDQIAKIPGTRPVAFRFPCCDSKNTPSPRAFTEIVSGRTPLGNILEMSSSVMSVLNEADAELPRSITRDSQGRPRFSKYLPFPNFVNRQFNYPYPYLLNGRLWEFSIAVPDDWLGFNLQQAYNPQTIEDLQAYLDAVVIKRGVMNVVFHPYAWLHPEQLAAFVDYAAKKYGRRVKFLTFKEALQRLNANLLAGQSVRARDGGGGDNGVRLLDLNRDGYMDVLIGNDVMQRTRVWDPAKGIWIDGPLPVKFVMRVAGRPSSNQVRFGTVDSAGGPVMIELNEREAGAWRFRDMKWTADGSLLQGLKTGDKAIAAGHAGCDLGLRLRDVDGDGVCELLVANYPISAAFRWSETDQSWRRLPFDLPAGVRIARNSIDAFQDYALVTYSQDDGGVRFADIDADGNLDVISASEIGTRVLLYDSATTGWSRNLRKTSGKAIAMPAFALRAVNGGGWIADRQIWFQNEETARLPDGVWRRSFNDLLGDDEPRPMEPRAALKSLHVAPGYRVELVAAEPMVMDPVAFDWGPDGKLWVAEMADYPLGIDGKGAPGGRVRFLEDTDGDGQFDKSTIFLDGLNFPTGVMAWRDGVLVTAAPEVFLARDVDGDGKCDARTTLYEGFRQGNQQHRVNGLRWSMDGWVHVANGDSGGVIRSQKTAKQVDISSRDLRIRPDDGSLETTTGRTQFGLNRDDWGHWFGTSNPNPLFQFVLDDHYLRRNPHVAPPAPAVQVVDNRPPLFPLSRTLARFNVPDQANRFTSACSGMIYRDNLLPDMEGNAIICEPVHNLVHRESLTRKGLLFVGRRAIGEEESHLLRSTDNWFRPVMARTGPDGAIWIADMYRRVIEHPEWIPDDVEAKLDLRAGHDKGRIYRIAPLTEKLRRTPRLDKLDTEQLVAALDSGNGTERDRAQQLLLWRADKTAIKPLRELAQHSKTSIVRSQSLWTLALLDALDEDDLLAALADADPGVRAQALRLTEPRLNESQKLGPAALTLQHDADPDVQLQLAYALGACNEPRAGAALGALALRHADDPYLLAAVLSSLRDATAVEALVRVLASPAPPHDLVERLVAVVAAGGNRQALAALFARIGSPGPTGFADWQLTAAAQILAGMKARGESIDAVFGDHKEATLGAMLAAARALAADEKADVSVRAAAMRLLVAGGDPSTDLDMFGDLLTSRQPAEIQLAAVEALSHSSEKRAAERLLAGWDAYSPVMRGHVLDAIMNRPAWALLLLDRIEGGQISANQVDAARRQRLLENGADSVRQRAQQAFAVNSGSRSKVVEQFQSVLNLTGDRQQGREVFAKRCASCHVLDGQGRAVGADLASVGNKSPAALLLAMLDPNRAIEDKFVNYVALLDDGRQLSGLLAAESGESLTLRAPDGKDQVILRKDLESLKNTGKSLMPDGLERDMTQQDLADVIAYVAGFGPQQKKFDGNQPRVATPGADGSIELPATACRIFGDTVIFEPKYRNLGYWGSENDIAAWSIESTAGGRYRVLLDYACDDRTAGNSFKLEIAGAMLTGKISSTSSWDKYDEVSLGEIDLPAGPQALTFRSAGPLRAGGHLLDLRTIRLAPVAK